MDNFGFSLFIFGILHFYIMFFSKWHKIMLVPIGYLGHLFFSLTCVIVAYFLSQYPDLTYAEKGGIVLLFSPIVYNILFIAFELTMNKLYKRSFILTGRGSTFTHTEKRKKNTLDDFFSFILYIMTIGIPFLIRDLFWV